MTEFEQVLMKRDRMRKDEARLEKNRAHQELTEMIESGASYSEVEEMLMYDYGLEMDYLLDLI